MTTTLEPPVELLTDVDAPVRAGRSMWPRFFLAFLLGLVAVLAVGVGALYAYDQRYQDRILPGVHVGTVDLSGLTAGEAAERLHEQYDGLSRGSVVLVAGDRELTIPYTRARRAADIDGMVARALSVGRAGTLAERVIANIRTNVRGVGIEPSVTFDADALSRWVVALANAQHVSPTDATVARTKDGYQITPSVPGRRADATGVVGDLLDRIGRVDAPDRIQVDLPFSDLAPALTTEEAQAAVDAANRIATDLRITDGKSSWTIPAATIRSWITFKAAADGTYGPVIVKSRVPKALAAVAKDVAQAPVDARFVLAGSRITGVIGAKNGRALDTQATADKVSQLLATRAAGGATHSIPAVMTIAKPALTTADAKAYAPKMKLISQYSVYYFVIVNNHWGGNIEAPATKINGTVVPAGGVFDFWKVVGDLRKLPGTGPGNAIEGGKITVTGAFGGGICTTSTTLFNAAFRAGMIPMARQNHNEFINRYPPGLDATVWIVGNTKQTMSFKNDTPYPILITRTVTQDGNRRWLTFKIWSVPNGRTATVTNTVIQHGPRAIDTVVNDPTKPVGYRFRNNAPADGAKVWTTVSIYDHGKLHWSKRYFSNYPAVNGVLIVGTKPAAT
jgi:vancomycin resistance protein YoaR